MKNLKQVKFSRNQILVLQNLLVTAKESYTECMIEKPRIYDERGFYAFFNGFVESFVEHLAEDGYAYLED